MMERKTLARTVFLLYIAVVLYLCFGDFSGISDDVSLQFLGIGADKVVHFLMFLPFPVLFYFAFRRPAPKVQHSIILTLCIFLLGCAVAAGTELIQDSIPSREADVADFFANSLAILLSSAAVLIIDLNKNARNV